ncbi:MAG TPA: type IV pili twitching motility protein PilT, partial [Firmicutes bacterium]|nr:type IV pili twitching motility protein PilT [Bacillota bacterium]
VATPAVRNLIREGKTHQIYSLLQTGSKLGMQSLDASLRDLYARRIISLQEALMRASDPEEFKRLACV